MAVTLVRFEVPKEVVQSLLRIRNEVAIPRYPYPEMAYQLVGIAGEVSALRLLFQLASRICMRQVFQETIWSLPSIKRVLGGTHIPIYEDANPFNPYRCETPDGLNRWVSVRRFCRHVTPPPPPS